MAGEWLQVAWQIMALLWMGIAFCWMFLYTKGGK